MKPLLQDCKVAGNTQWRIQSTVGHRTWYYKNSISNKNIRNKPGGQAQP